MVYALPRICLENDTNKLLWDFDTIGSHNLGHKTRPYNNQQKKKKKKKKICKIIDFAVPVDHRIKLKESEKKDKYLGLAREGKKLRNMKVTIIPIVIFAFGTVTKGLLKGLEDLKIGGNHPYYYIIKNGQNTAKSSRDLRRLAVTQTPGNDHQLILVWKTLKE